MALPLQLPVHLPLHFCRASSSNAQRVECLSRGCFTRAGGQPLNKGRGNSLGRQREQYRAARLPIEKQLLLPHKSQCLLPHARSPADCAGVGNRGSSAVGRLIHNGKVSGAEMWCLDHDRKVLEQAGTANTVIVRKEEPHMVKNQYSSCSYTHN